LEFNVPFQHKYGYIRDETTQVSRCEKRPSGWAPLYPDQPVPTSVIPHPHPVVVVLVVVLISLVIRQGKLSWFGHTECKDNTNCIKFRTTIEVKKSERDGKSKKDMVGW